MVVPGIVSLQVPVFRGGGFAQCSATPCPRGRLRKAFQLDLCWFLPCLNWPGTNNPMKRAGIISRHRGAEWRRASSILLLQRPPWPPAVQTFSSKTASNSLLASLSPVHTWGQRRLMFKTIFFFRLSLFSQHPGE